jgi:hypothetical protein
MSASDVDLRKLAKVIFLGGVVWVLAFLTTWGSGMEIIAAAKMSIGPAVGWIVGNIQETGVVLSMDGLRK